MFPELQALSEKLLARPTPASPAGMPLTAYGYVRCATPHPAYVDACTDLLTWWSVTSGWRLSIVFRDNNVGSTALTRPGFTGLLDVLRLPDSAYAVVIDRKHLSGTASVASQLTNEVRRTGASLRVLADELAGETA